MVLCSLEERPGPVFLLVLDPGERHRSTEWMTHRYSATSAYRRRHVTGERGGTALPPHSALQT